MLTPEVAAKFSHYYSVDNHHILLFDPKPVPGFGGNHLPTDSIQYSSYSSLEAGDVGSVVDHDKYESGGHDDKYGSEKMHNRSDGPDLICTLGGDGLLMHARYVKNEYGNGNGNGNKQNIQQLDTFCHEVLF